MVVSFGGRVGYQQWCYQWDDGATKRAALMGLLPAATHQCQTSEGFRLSEQKLKGEAQPILQFQER